MVPWVFLESNFFHLKRRCVYSMYCNHCAICAISRNLGSEEIRRFKPGEPGLISNIGTLFTAVAG